MKKIYLISNDKIYLDNEYYTSNNDLNNILECLCKNYDLSVICRKSQDKLNFKLTNKFKIKKFYKIQEDNIKLLMISITPYNFFVYLYLLIIKKKIKGFVYLRSDGFLEYKYRYRWLGYSIYSIMFYIITCKLKVLSCSNNFTNVSVQKLLHPSELDHKWLKRKKSRTTINKDFLYVGRFKKDKGSYYLIKIFNKYLNKFNLTIVGNNKSLIPKKYHLSNITYLDSIFDKDKLINIYDTSRIFILPSYIEGFPKVISEALARLKPVIIFKDIAHVINGREGIFVCERNEKSIKETVNFILKKYMIIKKKIQKNFFFTKKKFKKELLESIKHEFK